MSAGKIQTDPRYEFETAKGATAAGLRLPQKSYARRKITKGHKAQREKWEKLNWGRRAEDRIGPQFIKQGRVTRAARAGADTK